MHPLTVSTRNLKQLRECIPVWVAILHIAAFPFMASQKHNLHYILVYPVFIISSFISYNIYHSTLYHLWTSFLIWDNLLSSEAHCNNRQYPSLKVSREGYQRPGSVTLYSFLTVACFPTSDITMTKSLFMVTFMRVGSMRTMLVGVRWNKYSGGFLLLWWHLAGSSSDVYGPYLCPPADQRVVCACQILWVFK